MKYEGKDMYFIYYSKDGVGEVFALFGGLEDTYLGVL